MDQKPATADTVLDHLRRCPMPLIISFGDHFLPIPMADIACRSKYDQIKLEALKVKELQRLDVLTLESVAKSQPPSCIECRRRSSSSLKTKLRVGGCQLQPSRSLLLVLLGAPCMELKGQSSPRINMEILICVEMLTHEREGEGGRGK
jgi:hypothetical protein